MRAKFLLSVVTGLALTASLAACGGSDSSSTPSSSDGESGGGGAKIAFLVPEDVGTWVLGKQGFEAGLEEACPDCEMLYYAAANDAAKQQTQADTALLEGADVLVVAAVDGEASSTIVTKAATRDVPVLGFGRTPGGPIAATMAWSDETMGNINATGLADAIDATGLDGQVVLLNGDATTPNTTGMTAGAESALGDHTVGASENVQDWSAANAQTTMDQVITSLGKDAIAGVMGADDNIAAGAIAAMKRAGMSPLPPVTGMNASPSAVQLILAGEQAGTEYLPFDTLGRAAAAVAADLAAGEEPETEGTITNATGDDVPFIDAPEPVFITKENIQTVLIDSGALEVSDICTAAYAEACEEAGIS